MRGIFNKRRARVIVENAFRLEGVEVDIRVVVSVTFARDLAVIILCVDLVFDSSARRCVSADSER